MNISPTFALALSSTQLTLIVVGVVVVVVGISLISMYNRLVRLRQTCNIEFVDGLLIIRVHHRIKDPAAHERLIRWVERFTAAAPDDLMAPVKLLPPVRS